jgi:hypothetical protein
MGLFFEEEPLGAKRALSQKEGQITYFYFLERSCNEQHSV